MKKHNLLGAWPILLLIAFANFLVLRYMNFKFPVVGHDFYYVLPRMVDARIYYLVNGLGVQWYTPTFGAGTPAFPNPVYTQFSLPQFMTIFFDLWTAVEFAVMTVCSLGVLCTYLLLRKNFELSKIAALLGAAAFGVNGYTINHLMAGHLPYHIFFFLPVLAYVFSQPVARPVLIVSVTGLVYGLSVYSAGVEALISMGLSMLICIFLFEGMRFDRKRFLSYAGGAVLGALLAAAKLSAVVNFMSRFPRELEPHSSTFYSEGVIGILAQLLGFPFFRLLGQDSRDILRMYGDLNNNPWGLWEHDTFLPTTILAFVILAGAALLLTKKGREKARKWWRAKPWTVLIGFFVIWFTVDLIVSGGLLFSMVRNMPVLKSFHVNIRFTSVFLLPLCIGGALAFTYIEEQFFKRNKWRTQIGAGLVLVTALHAFAYEYRSPEDLALQGFDASRILETGRMVNRGHLFPVKQVAMVPDDVTFVMNTSNTRPYEPIFGRNMEQLKPQVRDGAAAAVFDGKYNFTNPASLVFPLENGNLPPFDRISLADRDNMERFINRRATTWKVSTRQHIANWLTLLALVGIFAGLSWELSRSFRRLF